jgi:release factor glutamine methyltransferase
MTHRFESNQIDSPRLISEMLLTHVFGGERIDLYANVDRIATEVELENLRSFVKRTLDHEPVQYIVGNTWFYGLQFDVNSSTLIPRTCTETIVEQAMHYADLSNTTTRIADIGTGSGCIAITIATQRENIQIVATDVAKEALALAQQNATKHGVQNQITFIQGDGNAPISTLEPFDIICSNPPYIPDSEIGSLDPNVRQWEPKLALSGGVDGLSVLGPLLKQCPDSLANGGVLLLEIASSSKDAVLELAQANPALKEAKILRDRYGDDRFIRAVKS